MPRHATSLAHRRPAGSVTDQIAEVLAARGLNRTAIAGIVGNAYAESSLRPSATGYGGGGLWGFTAHPNSLSDLQAYARQRGEPWTSASLQTEFLLQHVSGDLLKQLNAASSPEAAAAIFMREFERPGIPRQGVRESAAHRAFSQLGSLPKASPRQPNGGGETSGSGSLSEGVAGDLMHAGLVAMFVLGGAAMIGLGITRLFGSQAKGAQ